MSYIYENDVSKLGGNLQTTVAYLLSLHKNEYEWNMLGIKVVGHIDALPIPDGTYEYGDAYMVGTETPYEMYVYTRADAMHTEDYWFNIGKFPQPGPQGPAGSGLSDVTAMSIKGVNGVSYNSADGATIEYNESTITSVDPNTHGRVVDDVDTVQIDLPIRAGQYLSMDADASDAMLEIKVDSDELNKDYVAVPHSQTGTRVLLWLGGSKQTTWQLADSNATNSTVMMRDSTGSTKVHNLYCNEILRASDGYQAGTANQLRYAVTTNADLVVSKTSTDTGTMSSSNLSLLQQFTQMHIVYDNQIYYRMDPLGAPDGTLNYIHIDSVQDNGSYKATGKCFSITVNTRAWQVINIKFASDVAGSNETYVNTVGLYSAGNVDISLTLTTPLPINKTTFFDKFSGCKCICTWKNLAETGSEIKAGIILLGDSIVVQAGNNTYRYTPNQLTVSVSTHKVSQ